MLVSLTQVSRAISLVVILMAAVAVVPATHDVHDAADNDCRLCQLRHSTTAILSQAPTFVERLKSEERPNNHVVEWLGSRHRSATPSRAPPA